jgi:hypothetical protein
VQVHRKYYLDPLRRNQMWSKRHDARNALPPGTDVEQVLGHPLPANPTAVRIIDNDCICPSINTSLWQPAGAGPWRQTLVR